jgi:hypothetical protein
MKTIVISTLVLLFFVQVARTQPIFLQKDGNLFVNQIQKYSFQQEMNLGSGEKKSVPTAVLYSLLLPGMGELYADNYGRGKYFTIAEGALWVTLIGFDQYGRWLQNDARNYAVQHAGVSRSGKGDRYFIDIGEYMSVQDYNQQMLRDRLPHKVLDEHSADAWNWDTKANQLQYRNQRIASDVSFNNTKFVTAAIIINHIISAIDAARLVVLHNRQVDAAASIDIHASVMGEITNPHGIMISFSKNF